jgi:hypothetical protein
MQAVLRDMVVKPVWLVKLEFITNPNSASSVNNITYLYLSSRRIDVSWSGQLWLGNGWLRGFDGLNEAKDQTSTSLGIILGGYDPNLVSLVLSSTRQVLQCQVYFGLLDTSNNLIADPYLLYPGSFDSAEINEAAEDATITLRYENDLTKARKLNVFRFTHQSQQALFPGDLGFQYVSQAADWSGFWGQLTAPKANQKKKRNEAK